MVVAPTSPSAEMLCRPVGTHPKVRNGTGHILLSSSSYNGTVRSRGRGRAGVQQHILFFLPALVPTEQCRVHCGVHFWPMHYLYLLAKNVGLEKKSEKISCIIRLAQQYVILVVD